MIVIDCICEHVRTAETVIVTDCICEHVRTAENSNNDFDCICEHVHSGENDDNDLLMAFVRTSVLLKTVIPID